MTTSGLSVRSFLIADLAFELTTDRERFVPAGDQCPVVGPGIVLPLQSRERHDDPRTREIPHPAIGSGSHGMQIRRSHQRCSPRKSCIFSANTDIRRSAGLRRDEALTATACPHVT